MTSPSSYWRGPARAEPDFSNLLAVLRHERPSRPTLFEFFMNDPLYRLMTGLGSAAPAAQLRIAAFRAAGYDYVTHWGSTISFPSGERAHGKSVSMDTGFVITDRKSFDAYNWPDPDAFDYRGIATDATLLPRGMKFVVCGPCGVLENAVALLGYSNLCLMLVDNPPLLQDVFNAIGSRLVRHYEKALEFDAVGAIIGNDDWGFKTQPMLSPAQMRHYVFPWHKRIVEAAHKAGRPAILHSCGNLSSVMDDIVTDMKYDGKHSYEDTIMPVEEAYEQYSRRIAILGGIDLDFVCRSTPDQVFARSSAMLERAAHRGSFALGTGNSVPEYVPAENYFAMIAAVKR